MFEKLLKDMSSIFDDVKEGKHESEYVDVTTDEGIKKVRDSVKNMKESTESLKEKFKDSWISYIWDEDALDSIDKSLDELLEDAEKKYKEAHENAPKEEKSVYVRPVLLLDNEDASRAYKVVDEYLEKEICPRLPEDTTPEFVQSIKESLVDFAAWLALKEY